jgi:RsiW-degrading membrane proteinase PrsW (M82 family)
MSTETGLVLSVLASALPTAVYVAVLWWLDKYEKEPLSLLAVAFAWGALPAAALSIVTEVVLDVPLRLLPVPAAQLISSSAVAPAAEEVFKALILVIIVLTRYVQFDDVLDGIIYGALIGFGFAMTENVLYFFSAWHEGGPSQWGAVVFLRVVLFGLNHAFFTSITGAGLGYARLSRSIWRRWLVPLLALAVAIGFHATHNLLITVARDQLATFVVSTISDWGGVLVILMVIRMTWHEERKWLLRELADEVVSGVISATDYDTLVSQRRRIWAELRVFANNGWGALRRLRRIYQLAARLAFKKHQLRVLGESDGNLGEIATLRAELGRLRSVE